jgi:phage regulator Rha-like protein
MNELVFLEPNKIDSEPFTTSDIIAEYAGVQHHTITRLIQKYNSDFEYFGILRFEIEVISGRGQPERHYKLNEQQASLLVTYLKNTSVVRNFKKELVRQFYAMRDELFRRRDYRAELKPIRREMTDVIKAQEPDDKWAYKKYTDLSYKLVTGKIAAKLREERGADKKAVAVDYLTADELSAVSKTCYQIAVLLEMGFAYQQIKETLLNKFLRQS